MAAMRDVSATETAIIYALEPVWGGGFAWFLLGERWGIAGWIGAALVLGNIIFINYNLYIEDLICCQNLLFALELTYFNH